MLAAGLYHTSLHSHLHTTLILISYLYKNHIYLRTVLDGLQNVTQPTKRLLPWMTGQPGPGPLRTSVKAAGSVSPSYGRSLPAISFSFNCRPETLFRSL